MRASVSSVTRRRSTRECVSRAQCPQSASTQILHLSKSMGGIGPARSSQATPRTNPDPWGIYRAAVVVGTDDRQQHTMVSAFVTASHPFQASTQTHANTDTDTARHSKTQQGSAAKTDAAVDRQSHWPTGLVWRQGRCECRRVPGAFADAPEDSPDALRRGRREGGREGGRE